MPWRGIRACGATAGLLASMAGGVRAQEPAPRAIPAATGDETTDETTAVRARVLGQKIALHVQHGTLGEALKEISAQTGIRLTYSRDQVPVEMRVSLTTDNITVGDALALLLRDTRVDVVVSPSGWITLRAGASVGAGAFVAAPQNTGQITGHVIDGILQSPLAQVSVRIEGLSLSAVSGTDGRYTIAGVAPGMYHVTGRRVGYQSLTKDVVVTSDQTTTTDFALAAAPTKLDEVVTTAVGEQRRYEVGNVISSINADSITPTAPITSVTDLISARAPGVQIVETGGLTGSGEAIRIRGQSSVVLQSDPILIVDGVRQDNTPGGVVAVSGSFAPSPSRLNDIDFSQIETIDILKGPAASTEYGTDAANGVIVITTKRGTAGRPTWQASAEQTASRVPVSFPEFYYSWGHTTDGTGTATQCALVPPFDGLDAPFGPPYNYGTTYGTCVVDSITHFNPLNNPRYSLFGTGTRSKYDLSVGGGSETLRYYVAAGLSNETGVTRVPPIFRAQADALGFPASVLNPNSEDQRSVRTNTSIKLGQTADLTATGAYLSTYQVTPPLSLAITSGPVLADSAYGYGYGPSYNGALANIGALQSQQVDRLTGGLTANWRPEGWLVAHGTVGLDHGSRREQHLNLPQAGLAAFGVGNDVGYLIIDNSTTDIYSVDLRASATAALTRRVRAITSLGLQMVDTRTQGIQASAYGLPPSNLTLNGSVNPRISQTADRTGTLGGYAEEQIGISDRLFLTGALRVDAGSGFGYSYSTAAYPKASVSWLAVDDRTLTVRLRGALGESGVQPNNGAALELYAPNATWVNGAPVSSTTISTPGNPNLRPERSVEYEGGLDIGLWQNRVSVELTGYSKTTQDALYNQTLGFDLGQYLYQVNLGAVRNTGAEALVTVGVVQTPRVMWNVTVAGSVNNNKLLHLAPGVPPQALGFSGQQQVAGYPLYGYWGLQTHFADANRDGVIEPSEETIADSISYAGPSLPTREVSVSTQLGLLRGALTINALADYRGGYKVNNVNAGFASTVLTLREQNDPTAPLALQARALEGWLCCSRSPTGLIEDGSFLRIRELGVTYAVPHHWVDVIRLQSVSVTAAVRNLALWTRYTGPDPEVAGENVGQSQFYSSTSFYVNNDIRGDGPASVPLLRYWVFRLNLGL